MSMQAEQHCWRIRKTRLIAVFFFLLAFVLPVLGVWCAPWEPDEPGFGQLIPRCLLSAMFLSCCCVIGRDVIIAVSVSSKGIVFKRLFRTETYPLHCVREIFRATQTEAALRRGFQPLLAIRFEGRCDYIFLRECMYLCDSGEIERTLRAFCPDAIDDRTLSLTDLARGSKQQGAAGDASPQSLSIHQRINSFALWRQRTTALILLGVCACLGGASFWWMGPDWPAHWIGSIGASIVALWIVCDLGWREVLEIDVSAKGIGFRFLAGSKFYPREAIRRVRFNVFEYRSGRSSMIGIYLQFKGRWTAIRLAGRFGSDVIKALAVNFVDVCEVYDGACSAKSRCWRGNTDSSVRVDSTSES